jgi:hypothetical protein
MEWVVVDLVKQRFKYWIEVSKHLWKLIRFIVPQVVGSLRNG